MSHLNKVRKIKDSKKDPTKPDEFELKLKKDWDYRFANNKLIEKGEGKRYYDQNLKLKKDNKKYGKYGYKIFHDKNSNNYNNKNKLKIYSNNIFMNNNIGGGDNEGEIISIFDENKLRSIENNNRNNNRSNNIGEYNFFDNNYLNLNISDNNSNYNKMPLDDINKLVIFFWDKLGVKELFKTKFNELKEEMENDDAKKEFMIMEIQNLELLDKFLKILCKEIDNRENQIHKLKRIIKIIENQYIDLNIDIDDSILNEFFQAINNYRVITIKVVESITYYNQFFYYFIYKGKFDEEYLMRKYKLLNNEGVYLLKIRNDLNFLGKSKINGYKQLNLNFNSNSDPFLLNVCEQIPINIKDYHRHIKQCQYLIMQGVILNIINSGFDNNINDSNAINNNNESIKNNNLEQIKTNNHSKVNNNSNSMSNSNKLNINCIDKIDNINIKNSNNNYDINVINVKENNIKRKKEKIVIETQLIDKNNYDNFFANKFSNEEQSEEQTLEELKKEFTSLKVLKRNKKESNNRIKIDGGVNEHNNKNDENKIRKIKYNKEEEKKEDINEINKKEAKNLENKIINENKEEEPKEDNKKEEINKANEKVVFDNNNNDFKFDKEKDLNEIKENKEDFVDTNININEEKNKIKNNKDNNLDYNKLENSVVSKNGINSKEKSLSVTPKSKRGSKILSVNEITQNDNLKKDNNISNDEKAIINIHSFKDNSDISFYCGKISNFISIYSSYYNTIPEEQKTIFNLKSEPKEYLYNNFFPKIIIYNDKKSKLIKGLCIFSHIFTSDSKNNGLFIEHISSYNEEEREIIFEKLLLFIKENSYNIFGFENNRKEKDIYIDLYYKFDNGKFNINTDIRDFFRNQLKFKWVKLENISKYMRYQKMRHQFMINSGNDNIDLLNNEIDDNNILNVSILGRKEFNNDENNNESDKEEESEDDEIDISRVFDTQNYKENNEKNKDNINSKELNKKEIHSHKICNLLNNLSIKNKTVLKFKNKNIKKKNNVENIRYSNPFNLIYLLGKVKECKNINYEKIISNVDIYFNKSESNAINLILSKCFNKNKTLLIEDNMFYSDIKELEKENKNKFKINANINIFPIFDNCISFKYKNYYYNRIHQKNIQIFMEVQTQQTFYMINKTENLILLISSSLNDNFKKQYINKENKDNLSIKFKNIYNNLIDVKNKDDIILYIPSFEIKCKLENNCFTNVDGDKSKYNLYCLEDYYNIKYLAEELMGIKYNKNMKKNVKMNFEYDLINEKEIEKELFIKDDFLLVILNLNVIESFGSLPLLTLYIKKDKFISEQKI